MDDALARNHQQRNLPHIAPIEGGLDHLEVVRLKEGLGVSVFLDLA